MPSPESGGGWQPNQLEEEEDGAWATWVYRAGETLPQDGHAHTQAPHQAEKTVVSGAPLPACSTCSAQGGSPPPPLAAALSALAKSRWGRLSPSGMIRLSPLG